MEPEGGGRAPVVTERETKLLAFTREHLDAVGRRERIGPYLVLARESGEQEDLYLDTADFRLFGAGLALRFRRRQGGLVATLKQVERRVQRPLLAERGEMEEAATVPDAGTVPALPPGIAARLEPLLSSRTLEPLLRVRTQRTTCVLDEAGNTRGELCLDRVQVLRSDAETAVAGFFEVEIEDRGAGAEALHAIGRELIAQHGLLPSTLSKFERGLAALGMLERARGDDRTHDVVVRPDDRLVDAAYRVLRKHFTRLRANEPGTRLGEDPEFLHDMRVSTRRLRAAFRTFRNALPEKRATRFVRDLRWIAALLGEVRDLDVYLEALPDYLASLAEGDRAALDALRANLARRRRRARTLLLRGLETTRYARFLASFETFLAAGPSRRPRLPAARETVRAAAPGLVARAHRRVLRGGRAIAAPPRAEDLHRLRILCKRLRYTCEFFADAYGKPMRRFIRRIVRLQDLLGAHQDACVAVGMLRTHAASLPTGRRESVRTALALGQLIAAKDAAAAQARAAFRAAWRDFDQKGLRRQLFL